MQQCRNGSLYRVLRWSSVTTISKRKSSATRLTPESLRKETNRAEGKSPDRSFSTHPRLSPMEDPMDQVSSPTINGLRIANTIHLPGHDGTRIAYKIYARRNANLHALSIPAH